MGNSRAVLRTECVSRARLSVARLDDVGDEALYLAALKVMMMSPPSVALAKGDNVSRCSGGASSGLQPIQSLPPGSMFLDDSVPSSPDSSSRESDDDDAYSSYLSKHDLSVFSVAELHTMGYRARVACDEEVDRDVGSDGLKSSANAEAFLDQLVPPIAGRILRHSCDDLTVPLEASM